MILPCIICNNPSEDVFPGDSYNQPYKANAFTTCGHYGSTVFDPMPSFGGPHVWLELNICDACLEERKEHILLVEPITKTEYKTRKWQGGEDKCII